MKPKLKTIRMSAKAEVSLQSKYCLNKNSLEPPMTATEAKSNQKLRTKYICVKVPLTRWSTSAESFFIIIICHLLVVDRLSWISSCSESFLTRRFSKLVIKEGLWITSLNILPKKREIDLDMLHLLKKRKVAVKHSCSARDQIPRRLVFDIFPFSSFRTPVIGEIDLSSPESVI